jgi:hypothetical protein
MERAAQITRRNNYPFLQPQHLELLLEVNMASCAKHRWSALQSAFTTPKFSASVGDALMTASNQAVMVFFILDFMASTCNDALTVGF